MKVLQLVDVFFFQLLILLVGYVYAAKANNKDACGYCKYMVATFNRGLNKTSNAHFAGGNTDWEERKLGRFKTSETRFIEIWESVCKKGDSDEHKSFDSLKDRQFRCSHLAEDNEELFEKWFFKKQDSEPDLFKYICIDELRRCCPEGRYGSSCAPCPGALVGAACFGRGKCDGDGTREGSGKCECDKAYTGVRCSNCDAHHFAVNQNETSIECKACFDGCATGCTSEEPTGCFACRSGYQKDEKLGCVDINECEFDKNPCTKAHEKCVNTLGHYSCECVDGYARNFDNDECEIDVNAAPYDGVWRPDRMLRAIAMLGLTAVAGFILAFHRTRAALIALVVAGVVFYAIERKIDDSTFTAEIQKLLKF